MPIPNLFTVKQEPTQTSLAPKRETTQNSCGMDNNILRLQDQLGNQGVLQLLGQQNATQPVDTVLSHASHMEFRVYRYISDNTISYYDRRIIRVYTQSEMDSYAGDTRILIKNYERMLEKLASVCTEDIHDNRLNTENNPFLVYAFYVFRERLRHSISCKDQYKEAIKHIKADLEKYDKMRYDVDARDTDVGKPLETMNELLALTDLELIARVIFAEQSNAALNYQEAVAWTIINRANRRKESYREVVTARSPAKSLNTK